MMRRSSDSRARSRVAASLPCPGTLATAHSAAAAAFFFFCFVFSMRGEVVLSIPAKKAWEMFTNNEVLSKIEPDMLASAEYIQGDGTPGSLRLFKLGPALQGYVKESMQRIEKVEPGQCMSYRVVGGELRGMYDPYRVTFSFFPVSGKENEQCNAEWKAEFEPLSPAVPPPEKAKEAALGFLKCFERSQLCT